jgi:hypothetical protein
VDKLEGAADSNKTVKAETWRKIRQKMVRKRRSLTQTDPSDGAALEEVIEEWDELPVRTLERRGGDSQKFLDEYQRAREQYRIYVSLSDGRAVDNNGHVRALSSKAGLTRTFKKTFTGMRDDFMHNAETKDFLRMTQDLSNDRILPSVGNSGTATRMAGQFDIDRNINIAEKIGAGDFTGIIAGGMKAIGEGRSRMLLAPEIGPRGEALSRAGALPFLDLLREDEE